MPQSNGGQICSSVRLADDPKNPTSPLGVGGLERFFFHLPSSPSGRGLPLPPTPSPGPGRAPPRRVGASKMAQDGSKRASESPR